MNRFFLILLAALFTPFLGWGGVADFSALENAPIQSGGRQRPFGTFATETMQRITGRATYVDEAGAKRPPMEMVFEIATHPEAWQDRPLVLISYAPLREAIGFPKDRKLFSLKELFANSELRSKMMAVEARLQEPGRVELSREETEVRDLASRLSLAQALMSGAAFTMIPPPEADGAHSELMWITPGQAATAYPGEKGEAAAQHGGDLFRTFLAGDQAAFSEAARRLSEAASALHPSAVRTTTLLGLETTYNRIHPFRWAWAAYALAAIVLGVTSLAGRATGYRIAWALVLAGFALQCYGFVARILIGSRGPVTNMYESVVWVAFGTILFAMILEAIYRSRYLFLAALPVAVITLILADTQTDILNPAIDPLSGVLRSNFWLSTHVTSITLSYAAFALALGVGHIILGKVLLGRKVSPPLYNYLYRSLQIGVLLLAIGTILGGVWANYSWGRFWDWDPKETWALIALLGYLALLHGRFAGWWSGFGLAVGSILAFQSVVMAWYGVNFVLGQGLHSYGFGTGGFPAVLAYVIAEVVFVVLVIARRASSKKGSPRKEKQATTA